MTPADTIRPIARLVDQAHPDLKVTNTRASCFHLLAMIAKAAGPDYAFIGKTANMDGEGKFTPAGFSPLTLELLRDDGEKQVVTIVALSMDALWYLPTMRQVKVIVNSTDGEPGGAGKPARLDCYDIEPIGPDGKRQYRWHNPPIAQSVLGQTPDAPKPLPPPLPAQEPYPGDAVFDALGEALFADYAAAGQQPNAQMGRWFGRTVYDWLAKNEPTLKASIDKHQREWRGLLGL